MNNQTQEIITTPVAATKNDLICMILKYAFLHNASQTAVVDLFKMVNSIFQSNVLPNSRPTIEKLFNPKSTMQHHALCTSCKKYVGSFKPENTKVVTCSKCKKEIKVDVLSRNNYFVTLDPSRSIKNLLENNWTEYCNLIEQNPNGTNTIEDMKDGRLHKQFVEKLNLSNGEKYATYTFDSDGVKVFNRSEYQLWLVQLIVNEIPVDERLESPILLGVYFGDKKPDMNIFLEPIVNMMNKMSNIGITITVEEENINIKLFGLVCCVDNPARAMMQGLTYYNGYFGCNWCEHPGVWSPELNALKFPYEISGPERNHSALSDMAAAVIVRQRNKKKLLKVFKNYHN